MTKDYKQSGRPKPAPAKKTAGGSSILTGLFIGLCIGVAIAVAAVLYLNKSGNAFFKSVQVKPSETPPAAEAAKPKAPEILTPKGASGSLPAPVASADKPAAPAASASSKDDRFNFYDLLPGGTEQKPNTPAPKPAEAPTQAAPAKGSYLQVASFPNETDADNLKAKLAFMGVEANIQTVDLVGKGVMHRVRIGPFAKIEDVDRARAQLKLNGIDGVVVKN